VTDVGDLFPSDAGDATPINRILVRRLFNYLASLPDISTQVERSEAPEEETTSSGTAVMQRGILKAVNDDTLLLATLDIDDNEGDPVTVARDPLFRKTRFDGLSLEGITYTYETIEVSKRDATDGVDTIVQEIFPKYTVDFSIIHFVTMDAGTGIADVTKQEIVGGGRAWVKTGVVE
jgi:hypothetical protein